MCVRWEDVSTRDVCRVVSFGLRVFIEFGVEFFIALGSERFDGGELFIEKFPGCGQFVERNGGDAFGIDKASVIEGELKKLGLELENLLKIFRHGAIFWDFWHGFNTFA